MLYDDSLNPVLEKASNEDLQYLVEIINKAMTNSLESDELYKKYNPDHQKYVNVIASEIRAFGGNTFVNIFRSGKGPEYKEIVCDVADKLKAPYNKKAPVEKVEDAILETVLNQALEQMSESEKQDLLKEFGEGKNYSLSGPALATAFITIFRMGGFKSYQLTVLLANAIVKAVLGHGLRLGANAGLTKLMSILTGPIGWIITGIWTAIDVAGPATRVTIPAVIYVAMLRKKYNTPVCPHCNQMISIGAKFCIECGGHIDNVQPLTSAPIATDELKFKMKIDFAVYMKGRGVVCSGRVEYGNIKVGDLIDVEYQGGIPVKTKIEVIGIEQHRRSLDEAKAGGVYDILLNESSPDAIRANMVVVGR